MPRGHRHGRNPGTGGSGGSGGSNAPFTGTNAGRKTQLKVNICKDDPHCASTTCPFAHPSRAQTPTMTAPAPAPVSHPPVGQAIPLRKACIFGKDCFNQGSGCVYWHPGEVRTKETCQFGIRCDRGGCWYQHPHGRVVDGTACVPDCPFWIRWGSCPYEVCHDNHPGKERDQCRNGIYCRRLVYTPETQRWTCVCDDVHIDRQIPDWFRRQDALIYELDAFEKNWSIRNGIGSRLRSYYIDTNEGCSAPEPQRIGNRPVVDPYDYVGFNRGLYGNPVCYG